MDPLKESFYIQWHLTNRCNLRCRHCYQESYGLEKESDPAEWEPLAEKLLQFCRARNLECDIALTGGEPLLLNGIWPLLRHLYRQPETRRLGLITNGTLLQNFSSELREFLPKIELVVSLEGASAAVNDLIRGAGSFALVLRNLEKMREAGIPFIVMATLMRSNVGEAEKLIGLCRRIGARSLVLERYFPLGTGAALASETLDGPAFLRLWQHILKLHDLEADPRELLPYRAIRIGIEDGTDLSGSECVVAESGLALMPDGTVYPCRRFELAVGNLRRQSLDEIWESDLMRKLRDKKSLRGICRNCGLENCRGCRAMSFLLTADPLGADPHCWL